MKSATFAQSLASAPFLLLLLHLIVEFHDLRTHILSTRSHTSYWRLPSHTRDGQVKKSHARGTKHNTKLISRVQFVKKNSIFLFFLFVDEDFVEKLSLKLYKRKKTFVFFNHSILKDQSFHEIHEIWYVRWFFRRMKFERLYLGKHDVSRDRRTDKRRKRITDNTDYHGVHRCMRKKKWFIYTHTHTNLYVWEMRTHEVHKRSGNIPTDILGIYVFKKVRIGHDM